MHERTLVPFLVSPVDVLETLQFFPYFSILLLRCRAHEFLESCVAAMTATVSASSSSLLNFETSPVIYPTLQVDF